MADDIPIEILLHILSFIPNDELNNVMLVNKDFYRYCSKKLSFKNKLSIDKIKLDDKSMVDSMSNSLRRFDHLTIDLDNYDCLNLISLHKILQNIGEKIVRLDFFAIDEKNVELKQSVLISWLNTMPNLEKLRFFGSFNSAVNEIIDDPTTELNLRNLTLVHFCPLGLGLKLHQMPNACIQILELNDNKPMPNIEQVFKTHRKTLRTLELFKAVYVDPLPFRQLKLIMLECHYREYMNNRIHNAFLMDIIEHQTTLTTLTLGLEGDKSTNCYPVNSELMSLICKQTQLIDISIGLNSDITPNDIYQLKNLKKLKRILLQTSFYDFDASLEVLEAIAITKIPSLKIFRLEADFDDVSQHLIQRMGESFPYLEEFTGSYGIPAIDAEFKTFNVFLDSFPHLTSLDLIESDYEFFPGLIYPKMKELIMYNDTKVLLSPQFIESMPNLEEIYIGNMAAQNETLMAIHMSKIKYVNIKISTDDENMSEEELKVCQEIALMIKNKGAEFLVEFLENEEDSSTQSSE